jgi:hypothetical protein
MVVTKKLREDIAALQTCWQDRFRDVIPPPSQFAAWLRLYPIDVVVYGFDAGRRWIRRLKSTEGKTLDDLIRYVSAVMRNENELRLLDEEGQ